MGAHGRDRRGRRRTGGRGAPQNCRLAVPEKWTLGANAVFDESYLESFGQTGLREFSTGLAQRTGSRAKIEMEMKPNAQKQTVDVIISFK